MLSVISHWYVWPPRHEFERYQIIKNPKWKISRFNQANGLNNYPDFCNVPATLTDENLKMFQKCREEGYYPLLIYAKGDVFLLTAYRDNSSYKLDDLAAYRAISPKITIFDVGYKRVSAIPEIAFFSLPDTSKVARYWHELEEFLSNPTTENMSITYAGWCSLVNLLLESSRELSCKFIKGESILLQGSSKNWNHRIILSLIQLFIDPFYRTIHGFCVLVEKDWVGIPYDFQSGRTSKEKDKKTLPYFDLFCNAVFLLMREFPNKFEFTPYLLDIIADLSQDSRFGTFLFHRFDLRVLLKQTPSAWDYIINIQGKFFNWNFNDEENNSIVLFPETCLQSKYIWSYFAAGVAYQDNQLLHATREKTIFYESEEILFTSVLECDLLNMQLNFVPNFVCEFENLQKLTLVNNQIVSLPLNISKLTTLRHIDLSENPMEDLCPKMMEFFSMVIPDFCSLTLNHTSISFPQNIPGLKALGMNNSPVVRVWPNFVKAPLLQALELQSNFMEKIPSLIQTDLINLIELDLTKSWKKRIRKKLQISKRFFNGVGSFIE